jgi:hypothetical protein
MVLLDLSFIKLHRSLFHKASYDKLRAYKQIRFLKSIDMGISPKCRVDATQLPSTHIACENLSFYILELIEY